MFKDKMELIKSSKKLKDEIQQLEQEKQNKISSLNIEIKDLENEKAKRIDGLAEEDRRLLRELEEAKVTISSLRNQIEELESKRAVLEEEYIELDDNVLYQSYGIFIPEYRYELSEEYKMKLDEITNLEKELVKSGDSFVITQPMTLNNSQAKGLKMQEKNGKLAVRAFKSETDDTIKTITAINFQSKVKKIDQVFKQINALNGPNCIELSDSLRKLAHEKLELLFEYKLKVADEKEQLREQREQLREQQRAEKEMELAFKKLETEKQKFLKEQVALNKKLETANTEEDKEKISNELSKISAHITSIEDEEVAVNVRLSNTRAGHVYIISNIGSFGDEVFKIGMTRRFEPLDRVKELGDASVPFTFDVHALIFTEDAYGLENQLHTHFSNKRVNKINNKKEFFNVSLEEIKDVVQNIYQKPVSFIDTPEALDYRETLVIERQQ